MPEHVPISLIHRLCYPTSKRLPKLEYLVYPPPQPKVPDTKSLMLARFDATYGRSHRLVRGNLPNDEYRFWMGTESEHSPQGSCRWCGATVYNLNARKAHKKSGCQKHLTTLYRILLSEKTCLVCESINVRSQYWGIPLCSPACRDVFRFKNPDMLRLDIVNMKKAIQ